ncbi:MAG: MATE family efflux transporter, partial [Peptococcaceae bacterium]|nr:MATE family efflux transporter [Peptococcaceae bacterium]
MDLLKDAPKQLFSKYLVPSVSATMVTSIYILADSIMIGKGIGELAIAALNIVLPLFNIMFGTGALFGVGGAVLFSVAMGNGDTDR